MSTPVVLSDARLEELLRLEEAATQGLLIGRDPNDKVPGSYAAETASERFLVAAFTKGEDARLLVSLRNDARALISRALRLSEVERERDDVLAWQTAAKQELTTKELTNSDLWARTEAAERETARLRGALLECVETMELELQHGPVMRNSDFRAIIRRGQAALSTATTPAPTTLGSDGLHHMTAEGSAMLDRALRDSCEIIHDGESPTPAEGARGDVSTVIDAAREFRRLWDEPEKVDKLLIKQCAAGHALCAALAAYDESARLRSGPRE